jgi:hypothetical protein
MGKPKNARIMGEVLSFSVAALNLTRLNSAGRRQQAIAFAIYLARTTINPCLAAPVPVTSLLHRGVAVEIAFCNDILAAY